MLSNAETARTNNSRMMDFKIKCKTGKQSEKARRSAGSAVSSQSDWHPSMAVSPAREEAGRKCTGRHAGSLQSGALLAGHSPASRMDTTFLRLPNEDNKI